MKSNTKLQYGDYQTPKEFCNKVVEIVSTDFDPSYVYEPTFGSGNFIDACRESFKNVISYFGNEINRQYYLAYKAKGYQNVELFNKNIFDFKQRKIINRIKEKPLLIIGNPPWVTNSELAKEGLTNLPKKSNIENLSGVDAMTGKSNFDIAESIIEILLDQYRTCNFMIAMLCETNVATNIIKKIDQYNLKDIKLYKFSAKKVFGVDTEACLFCAKSSKNSEIVAGVYDLDNPTTELYKIGIVNGKFYAKIEDRQKDGKFFMEWHSGVKHDLQKIMELEKLDRNLYENGLGEIIELEDTYIYPLCKSSDLHNVLPKKTNKFVIVTQKYIGENTLKIEENSPKLWNYLKNHEDYFEKRKSKIYKKKYPFSLFGIGPYTFKKYKIAISTFYKKPCFCYLDSEKPTVFDDTVYFISFDNETDALINLVLLNSNECKKLLSSIVVKEGKRIYTKEVLMRINMASIAKEYDYERFKKECELYTQKLVSEKDFDEYKKTILDHQNQEPNFQNQ